MNPVPLNPVSLGIINNDHQIDIFITMFLARVLVNVAFECPQTALLLYIWRRNFLRKTMMKSIRIFRNRNPANFSLVFQLQASFSLANPRRCDITIFAPPNASSLGLD